MGGVDYYSDDNGSFDDSLNDLVEAILAFEDDQTVIKNQNTQVENQQELNAINELNSLKTEVSSEEILYAAYDSLDAAGYEYIDEVSDIQPKFL
jgi:hypothetical protein